MFDLNTLKFDEKGLIPAVVVDALSKKVLTVAYMNRGKSGNQHERRQNLLLASVPVRNCGGKGETSGNFQHIVSITADCDRDCPDSGSAEGHGPCLSFGYRILFQ